MRRGARLGRDVFQRLAHLLGAVVLGHIAQRQDAGQDAGVVQHHQTADLMGDEELKQFLGNIKAQVDRTVVQLPTHQAYVKRYCGRPEPVNVKAA